MNIVEIKNLVSRYKVFAGEKEKAKEITVINGLSLSISQGEFVGILGHNGSGKSTLARQLTALLKPAAGVVYIKGMDTSDDAYRLLIRKTAGLVFQNPDNQLIGSTVEEDVAFGMENLGIPSQEMEARITRVLADLGMSAFRMTSPNSLSGGQKQKIALSGILAMEPECIVFDEPTAMLDPAGRREVLKAVHYLNRKKGITIIYITHHTDEVKDADRLYLLKQGELMLAGPPGEIWQKPDLVLECGVSLPFIPDLIMHLKRSGNQIFSEIPMDISEEKLAEEITGRILALHSRKNVDDHDGADHDDRVESIQPDKPENDHSSGIHLQNISYSYGIGADGDDKPALNNITLSIRKGEYLAIVGQTGSGKSTLLSHLNGLLFPTEGKYYFNGYEIRRKDSFIKTLRQKVGLCFQYPDHQLFEETVIKDIAFGPSNMGYDREKSLTMARKAMALVGLPSSLEENSPFTLSGGQKRRVAIAGILAMEPDYLVLDEPAAGLDKKGKEMIFSLLKDLNQKEGITIILVSHDMNEAAANARRIVVLKDGQCLADGSPRDIFMNLEILDQAGLSQPDCIHFYREIQRKTGVSDDRIPLTNEELGEMISRMME